MTGTTDKDWDPGAYARFRGLRLRPALDLLMQVGDVPEGAVVDMGCGAGAAGPALRERFPGRRLIGVDLSPQMLAAARATGAYDDLIRADASRWRPPVPVAVIFSNAALHWLPDHATLFPELAANVGPGGWFAVQMPRQYGAPSHRFLRDIAAEMFPDRFDARHDPPVSAPIDYVRMLFPLGDLSVWETDYIQRLAPTDAGHPVRAFTESTAMRPFLDRLAPAEVAAFTDRYDAALAAAYPPEADGTVIFPFRRLFLTLRRPS